MADAERPADERDEELAQLRQALAQRDEELVQLRQALAQRLAQRLPQHKEAEMDVCGAILFAGQTALSQIADILAAEDFHDSVMAAIYEAALALDGQAGPDGKPPPINLITVAEQMRRSDTIGKLKAYGGEAYLAELSGRISTIAHLPNLAHLVRSKATLRRLIEASQQAIRLAREPGIEADAAVEAAQQAIYEIAIRSSRKSYRPGKQVLHQVFKALEQRYNRKEAITGIPTDYTKFDEMTVGLQPGDLIIIAARPSMGKTAFVMNCVLRALRYKIPALVLSLEMTDVSLMERALSTEAEVPSERVRTGFLEKLDWIRLNKAASDLATAPLWLDDSGSPTLMEIRAKCRRWRSDPRVFPPGSDPKGLVVIDYLQLICGRSMGKEQSREREISEISRGLKALAKELGVPVVALSQLNRRCEERADKRPMASDLRESGGIEQDADLICFIYRDEVYDKESPDRGIAEIIIGKQRNGPTGTVRLAFLSQYTRFENLEEHRVP